MMRWFLRFAFVLLAVSIAAPDAAAQPRVRYERALQREDDVRAKLQAPRPSAAAIQAARRLIRSYEQVARLYPRSGYSDNALWQAGRLSADLWTITQDEDDRTRALRFLRAVAREYPSSSLAKGVDAEVERLERAASPVRPPANAARVPRSRPAASAPSPVPAVGEGADLRVEEPAPVTTRDIPDTFTIPPPTTEGEPAQVRSIVRTAMESFVRVTVELDREVAFRHDRLQNPDRIFIDLSPARLALGPDKSQKFTGGAVQQIRTGEQSNQTARIVLDVEGVTGYSVLALYDPFRLIVDCETGTAPAPPVASVGPPPAPATEPGPGAPASVLTAAAVAARAAAAKAAGSEVPAVSDDASEPVTPLPSRSSSAPPILAAAPVPVAPPSANLRGRFSLSRQLGLGISRIVIDPGHGGHDPGAIANGLREADLVLDLALRLEKLLLKRPGVEVVLTRRTNVFVPLEERTAIANRQDADLFLSIHANASRNRQARGVETYFLNFASNPEAEAVAARENAASGRTMRNLPDIVKAIAMNDKLDESRDFATMVQRAMVERMRAANNSVRDLGVKQAPFVVLIGAGMPSVLAEVSFVTNQQDARLLKGDAYRQRIAEALFDGIQRYQRSLKSQGVVATQ
jgi:N-acetylmuramoyl-L-alanine amidase